MKRPSPSLVAYSDSEEEAEISKTKKRKLPTLSASLVLPVPVDNPSKHQGRTRSSPHVEGQWAAHVYISLPLGSPAHLQLCSVVQRAFKRAHEMEPKLNPILGAISEKPGVGELHVSLTRPVFLRSHQREEFKQSVKQAASSHQP
jgi:hypothetical protein